MPSNLSRLVYSSIRLRLRQNRTHSSHRYYWGTLGVATGATALSLARSEPAPTAEECTSDNQDRPLSALIRSYFVFTICSFPSLVNLAPSVLPTMLSIPGLKQISEAFIRSTFFAHFVGGETVQSTLPIIAQMRGRNIGTLLAYSVEVDEQEHRNAPPALPDANEQFHGYKLDEMIRSIDEAADFEDHLPTPQSHLVGPSTGTGRCTWVAVKLVGLVPDPAPNTLMVLDKTALLPSADSLERFSDYLLKTRGANADGTHSAIDSLDLAEGRGLGAEDIIALRGLRDGLIRLCDRALARNVRVILDAEHR